MKAKINAVFKDTNNCVQRWRKCRQKLTFIEQVKNMSYVYENFVFQSSDKTRCEIERQKLYNKLFNNIYYFYIMKNVIKTLGKNIAQQVEKNAKDFESFVSGEIKVEKDNKKNVIGYSVSFTYKVTDNENNVIVRKGIVESSNNVEKWYIYDLKNGKTTDKKKLVKVVIGDNTLSNVQAKHGVKNNVEGEITKIATNLGLSVDDLKGIDFASLVDAKTCEQETALFMCAISTSPKFTEIATKLIALAKQAEKETRANKATENSYINVCKDNGITLEDFENALAITNNKNEAVQACLIAQKKQIPINKAIEAYRLLFA